MKHLLLILLLAISGYATAQKTEIFQSEGKAIKGYDAVAFFKEKRAVQGNNSYAWQWKDAIWLFASQANLDTFKAYPERFAPQYGGYCAYGMAGGYKAPTETDTWTILNEKLYFNYNSKVKEMWNKETARFIQKADVNWQKIAGGK